MGSGLGSGLGSGMGSGIPTPLLLLVLSTLHPIIGNVPEPLLVLEGPEQAGIRLRCLSERPFPEIQLLWSGANGENLTGIPELTEAGNAGSSLLLRLGFGNAASCRALDPQLGTAAESSVVIAEVFFPVTSPWLAALVLLLLLALGLALAAAFRLRRNSRQLVKERKSQQDIQEEMEELRMELEEVMEKFQRESQDMAASIERIRAQLGFRQAQSHAVSLTLDERCHHPSVAIRGRSVLAAGSGQRRALAVAHESFSSGKHYWEVELGPGHSWELGVLAEEIRDSLRRSWGDPLHRSPSDSLENSLQDSLQDSLENSLQDSPQDSLHNSLENSLQDSVQDSLPNSLHHSLQDSMQDSTQDSLPNSLHHSLQDSLKISPQNSLHDSLHDSMHNPLQDSHPNSLPNSQQDSLKNSLQDSLPNSLQDSQQDSLQDSVQDSLPNSQQDSQPNPLQDSQPNSQPNFPHDSMQDYVQDSVQDSQPNSQPNPPHDSMQDSMQDSVQDSQPNPHPNSHPNPPHDSLPSIPAAKAPALRCSRGELRLPGGKLLQRNSGHCRVLGVLLDQERRVLSFFDAEEKQRLGSVPLEIPGNLFPFFSPGCAGNALGIRPVRV